MKKLIQDILFILTAKERRQFFLSASLGLFVSVVDIVSLALLFYVIGTYSSAYKLAGATFLSGFTERHHRFFPVAILLVVFLFKSAAAYKLYRYQNKLVSHVVSRISSANLYKHMYGKFYNHINIDSSVLIRRILHQPIEFGNYILSGLQQIVTETMLIILSVIAICIYDVKLLLSISLVMLPAIVVISYITKKRLAGIKTNIKTTNEKTLQNLNEALNGFVESNVYRKNDSFIHRYTLVNTQLNKYVAEIQVIQGLPSRFFELFAVIGISGVIVLSFVMNDPGTVPVVIKLGAFAGAAYKIIPGISRIINLKSIINTYSYILKDAEPPLPQVHHTLVKPNCIQNIQIDNISFSYNNKKVLKNFSTEINTGKLTGIKGDSGKGKSTLVHLILGFLDNNEGDILFNGIKTTCDERKVYQDRVAYVKQQSLIMHESILDNIVLFDENHDVNRLNTAIEASGLTDFVSQFKNGIHHVISEDGKNISGGQKQRIAIARALYKDADLIILDEPFNELDEISELKIIQHLKQLAQEGKMIILITHNSKSIGYCDTIINLNEK